MSEGLQKNSNSLTHYLQNKNFASTSESRLIHKKQQLTHMKTYQNYQDAMLIICKPLYSKLH